MDELSNFCAQLFHERGYSSQLGRIFSLLLLAIEPLSVKEIADCIGLSKAALYIQIRVLAQLGYCRKLPAVVIDRIII